jgi:hypothetical protein
MSLDLAAAFQMDVIDWLAITLVLGGPAAFAAGKAVAQGWRTGWVLAFYVLVLSAFLGFLCWALFEVPVISASRLLTAIENGDLPAFLAALVAYALTSVLLNAIAFSAFAHARARQMVKQYPFLA